MLLSTAFAPIDFAPALIFGVALLVAVLRSPTMQAARTRFVLVVGFGFGLGFMAPLIWWMIAVSDGAYIALTLFQAAILAFAVLGLRTVLRLPAWPLWGSAVWLAFEYARSTVPFSGFPWGRLAHPAVDTPLASYARLLGIPATSMIVFLLGAMLVVVLSRRTGTTKRTATALGITALVGIGAALPTGLAGEDGSARVALIQGDVPGLFGTWPSGEIFELHLAQTQRLVDEIALGNEPRPDFILWPENGTDIDPFQRPIAARKIQDLSRSAGAPILIGGIFNGPTADTAYNAGVVWDADGPGDRYIKRKLVPYGEYVPFRQALGAFVPRVDRDIPRDMLPGKKAGAIDIGGVTIGDTICWDIAYDGVVRDAVIGGARVLVVQTSNASFTGTSQPDQQWQISRLRAIETGRTVLVPSTNGISGIVSAKGKTVEVAPVHQPATLTADVPLASGITTGVRWGGYLQWVLCAAALVGLVLGTRQRRHR